MQLQRFVYLVLQDNTEIQQLRPVKAATLHVRYASALRNSLALNVIMLKDIIFPVRINANNVHCSNMEITQPKCARVVQATATYAQDLSFPIA